MKKTLFVLLGFMITALLAGCTRQNLWDLDYNLTTEIGRQLHCYAQFQKDYPAKEYGAEWVGEILFEGLYLVEGKVKADGQEYNLVCTYPEDTEKLDEWNVVTTSVDKKNAILDPSAEFCNENAGEFEIVSNDVDIYGQCTLSNGIVCESWKFFNGECPALEGNNESEMGHPEFDLETEDGRLAACEERAGFYLNFGDGTFTWEDEDEGGASFVRNGHVVYEKWGEKGETDVECLIDMVDGSVNVEFSNQNSLGPIDE